MKPNEFFQDLKEIITAYSSFINYPTSAQNENVDDIIDDLNETIEYWHQNQQ